MSSAQAILLVLLLSSELIFGSIIYPKDLPEAERNKYYDGIVGMWCPAWRNVLCGNDGISYWNECLFKAAQQVLPGLKKKKPGPCNLLDCDDCENEEAMPGMALCGSNGLMLNSTCMFVCYKEEYPMLYRTFQHCPYRYPSKEDIEITTTDTYDTLLDDYMAKVLNVIQENNFNRLHLQNFTMDLEFNNTEIKIQLKKGTVKDLSAFKKLEPMFFYAYSHQIARAKIVFELESLEASYQKLTVFGVSRDKLKGSLKVKIGRSKLELIADIKSSENDCPLFEAISLRVTEIDDVAVEFSPNIKLPVPYAFTDGLMKEKAVMIINDALVPEVLLKLKEIGCLDQRSNPTCYGIFQTRVCF